jgi:16S rRNA (cytosine1402-N4)-methyltransferase
MSRRELAGVLRDYGDEKWSDRIAEFVVQHREREPIETTSQFVRLVEAAVPRAAWPPDTHVATRSMMALRYAVNDDLAAITESIGGMAPMLRRGGRIVCLSFCGTEDRAVKNAFRRLERPCTCPRGLAVCACGRVPLVRVLTRRAVRPSPDEQARNRRSRSARARVAERI